MYIHRRGHNFQAKGAVGIIDEVVEADKINKAISKWFDIAGVRHIDASPSNCDSNTDLRYGVNIANSNNATLFFSIHLNKAYSSYNGAIGSEVCVHSNLPEADRVLSKLQALGLRNRGQKIRKDLYELNMTNMKAMIIEVCFCEATEDVAIYRRVGADGIAKAIVEGILGRSIQGGNSTPQNKEDYKMVLFSEEYYVYANKDVADAINKGVFKTGYQHFVEHGKKEGRLALPTIPKEFCEGDYLELNPDVAKSLNENMRSGVDHFVRWGWREKRKVNKNDTQEVVNERLKQLEKENAELQKKLNDIKNIVK